jgi:hypothetical protein
MYLSAKTVPAISFEKWREDAEQARAARTPILIHDAFSDLAAKWNPKLMLEQWPDKVVGIAVKLPNHGVPYREYAHPHLRRGTLTQAVRLIERGEPCYLNQAPIENFPEFKQDLNYETLALSNIYSVNLWMGGVTRSGLHYDNADNLFGQVFGKKRAILISPKYTKYVYPFSDNPLKSKVDPENPDTTKHPLYERCELLTCELEPGNGLYIPRGWWHFIAADEVSISINCWHGKSLTKKERRQMILAVGPRVVWRAVWDFAWHGILKRPYRPRLFSAVPPGLQIYYQLRSRILSVAR